LTKPRKDRNTIQLIQFSAVIALKYEQVSPNTD